MLCYVMLWNQSQIWQQCRQVWLVCSVRGKASEISSGFTFRECGSARSRQTLSRFLRHLSASFCLLLGSSGPAGTRSDVNNPKAWRDIFYRYWVDSVFILNARPVLATHCFSWPFLPAINLAGCICWVHFIPVRLIGGRPPGYSQSPKISSKCL